MIIRTLVVLSNIEVVWLYFCLHDSLTRYRGPVINLVTLAGYQVVLFAIIAAVCACLGRKESKFDFGRLSLVATAFSILGLCAAMVGGFPFLIGNPVQ
jgi:peptidoglycan biosynthesis protein MviN/MurJ (putative lipid II flippase)